MGRKLAKGVVLAGLVAMPGLAQYGIDGSLAYKPNFLFIIADDLSPHAIANLGNPVIKTPTIDSLAGQGMTFTNVYNQGGHGGGICKYSRYMLNTGLFFQPGVDDSPSPNAAKPFWGKAMQNLGYATYEVGKWHNGNASADNSFPTNATTGSCSCSGGGPGDPYFRPYGQGGTAANPKANGNLWKPTSTTGGHYASGINLGTNKHSSEAITDKAIQFLNNHVSGSNKAKPFLIYVAYNAPHDYHQAPQKYQDMYPHASVDFTGNYMPAHPFDNGEMKVRDEDLVSKPRDTVAYRQARSEYYAIISHLDDHIRRLLNALDATGKADSTYVIFTADNGLAVGEHGLVGKQNLYEHSTRVPFFIAGPGIPKGSRTDALVYMQTAYPTTVEIAGGTVPSHVQFESARKLLNGSATKGMDDIYLRYVNIQRGIRTPYYKLLVYKKATGDFSDPNTQTSAGSHEIQLFRLKPASEISSAKDSADIWEMRDLSDDPAYASIVSGHLRLLEQRMEEIGGKITFDTAVTKYRLSEAESRLALPKDTSGTSSLVEARTAPRLDFGKVSRIEVHGIKGDLLATLRMPAGGARDFRWDGLVHGRKVPMGMYFLDYVVDGKIAFRKPAFIDR